MNMTKEEIKNQFDKHIKTKIGYDQFIELSPHIQNRILSELQSDIEWIKGSWYTFNELFDMLKRDNCEFEVIRGDFGIHRDIIMFTWSHCYNDSFKVEEISLEWLERVHLHIRVS